MKINKLCLALVFNALVCLALVSPATSADDENWDRPLMIGDDDDLSQDIFGLLAGNQNPALDDGAVPDLFAGNQNPEDDGAVLDLFARNQNPEDDDAVQEFDAENQNQAQDDGAAEDDGAVLVPEAGYMALLENWRNALATASPRDIPNVMRELPFPFLDEVFILYPREEHRRPQYEAFINSINMVFDTNGHRLHDVDERDYLIGQNRNFSVNPGNAWVRTLVFYMFPWYYSFRENGQRARTTQLYCDVVDALAAEFGRFVEYVAEEMQWTEVSRARARGIVGAIFRAEAERRGLQRSRS